MSKLSPYLFYLLLFGIELAAILNINQGRFIYTLDDPYIHLALAENIIHGHYGINLGEVSSPSSSIIWPFILAPFTLIGKGEYAPLILNFLFSLITIFFFRRTVEFILSDIQIKHKHRFTAFNTILLILCCNLINLTFCGMEHSLHVMVISIAAYGFVKLHRRIATATTASPESLNVNGVGDSEKSFPWWFAAALIFSTLVRYEGWVITGPVLLYLFYKGYRKQSIIIFAIAALLSGAFSLFLMQLGLPALPLSIRMKTTGAYGHTFFILDNIIKGVPYLRTYAVIILSCLTAYSAYRSSNNNTDNKVIALCLLLSMLMQIFFFRVGAFYRYELYLWTWFTVLLIYFNKDNLSRWLQSIKLTAAFSLLLMLLSIPYITVLYKIPLASSNIYEQQYQMHRFLTEYYKAPVMITDLGWTSYKNDNYVFDLLGLGTEETFEIAHGRFYKRWIYDAAVKHNIRLLVIYNYSPYIPKEYKYIGSLKLYHPQTSAGGSSVVFIATDKTDIPALKQQLTRWKQTLPPGVQFTFN